jgi:cytochrome P450
MAFRRDPLGFLAGMARDFGDIAHFRLGRRHAYFISHPELIKDVLVTRSANFHKGPALKAAEPMFGQGLLTSEDPLHARQRKLVTPAFHPSRISNYVEAMVRYAQQTRDSWRDGELFDVHESMMHLTLMAVAKTLLDTELAEEVDQIGRDVALSTRMFERTMQPWGLLLNVMPLPINFRFLKARARIVETVERMIAARRAKPQDRGDFLSLLVSSVDESGGGGMSDLQIRAEAITIFLAGHETTANALTYTWLCLSAAPEVESKLHAEIDAVLGDRLPTVQDVPRLPYTRAVVAEAMRLYPPAWALGRTAQSVVRLGEYDVPKAALILMSQWVAHRDGRFWNEPLKFDPDRWLADDGDSPTANATRPRHAYFPFGGGPRSCIGEAFAWMELILMTATIAQRWRLRVEPGFKLELYPTITMRPRHGVPVRATARMR